MADDVPEEILKKYGEVGATLYKKTLKEGKALGAKTAKHPLSSEVASIVNQVIAKSEKEGYKAITIENLVDLCANMSKRGASDPDRSGVKALATKVVATLLSIPIPPKETKVTPPPQK